MLLNCVRAFSKTKSEAHFLQGLTPLYVVLSLFLLLGVCSDPLAMMTGARLGYASFAAARSDPITELQGFQALILIIVVLLFC